jgi:hypothetical protein
LNKFETIRPSRTVYTRRHQKTNDQDIGRFMNSMPPLTLFLLVFAICIIIVYAGVLIGYLRYNSGVREPEVPISTSVAAILGLLAFMLGFTFSLTWTRFAYRNSLVIQQAQAIETCYLRTSFLPEKQKQDIRKMLKEYLAILLGLPTTKNLEITIARIDELHLLMWNETASLVQEDIDSELRSIFISGMNEMIKLSVERKTLGLVIVILDIVWASLLVLAAMSMFAFGYLYGVHGIYKAFVIPFLPVAFCMVIVLIADLNSVEQKRRFKVTGKPLEYIRDVIERIP